MGGSGRASAASVAVLAMACSGTPEGAVPGDDSSGGSSTSAAATNATAGATGPSPTSSASAGDASTTAPPDGSTGTTAPVDDTTMPPADEGSSSSEPPSTSTSTSGSSSEGDPCGGAGESLIVFAEDATLTDPMQLIASSLPGNPQVAASYEAEQGTATFAFVVECEGEFRIWGLVWDEAPGADNGADSYYATVDGEPPGEHDWYYGCQTEGNPGSAWTYQRVMDWVKFDCVYDELVFPLAPGTHELTVRNRESGFGDDVAQIAAIVVSSDPTLDPTTLFDPSP